MADQSVQALVAEQIKKLHEGIGDDLVEAIAKREINKRLQALTDLYDKIEKEKKEFYKLKKPDLKVLNDAGDPISEGFSPDAHKKMKEAKDKIEKLEKIFSKGLNGDMGDVYNAVQ